MTENTEVEAKPLVPKKLQLPAVLAGTVLVITLGTVAVLQGAAINNLNDDLKVAQTDAKDQKALVTAANECLSGLEDPINGLSNSVLFVEESRFQIMEALGGMFTLSEAEIESYGTTQQQAYDSGAEIYGLSLEELEALSCVEFPGDGTIQIGTVE